MLLKQTSLSPLSQFKLSRQFMIGFVLLTLISTGRGMDLIVDANLTSPNGNYYPSLSSAITALLTGKNLIDSNNTITLLDSCLNVKQYFPSNTSIWPSVSQTGGGTLSISYSSTPTQVATDAAVTDQSVCNQLPTIVLASGSYIDIEYLDSFAIQGINIQYNGDTNLNYIYSVGKINISHFCLNSSEPSLSLDSSLSLNISFPDLSSFSLDSSFDNNFTIDMVSTFTMTDGIYLYDTLKTLSIFSTNQIYIDSLVFVNLDVCKTIQENLNSRDYPYSMPKIPTIPAVSISSDKGNSINVKISNIQTTCTTCSSYCYTPLAIFSVTNIKTVWMSSVSLQNCYLASVAIQQIFVIEDAQALNIDNFTVNNIQIGSNSIQPVDYFVYVSAVKNITISNVNLVNLVTSVFQGQFVVFYITDDISQGHSNYYPMSLNFTGWDLQGFSSQDSSLINCSFANFNDFGGGLLQNFFISSLVLDSNSYILNLNVQDPDTYTLGVETQWFTINNFTIVDSSVGSLSAVGYLNFYGTTIIEEQELVYINVTSLTSKGNTFNNAYFLQVVGMCTYVSNSVMQDDTYKSIGAFYWNVQTVSTLLVENMTANYLSLQSGSIFISANSLESRSLLLMANFNLFYPNQNMFPGPNPNYAETRPFMINNSTFNMDSLTGNSLIIKSTNPQVIIIQNTFSVDNMDTSGLMVIGNYQFYNGPSTIYYFPGSPNTIDLSYPYSSYFPFSQVEQTIFSNFQDLYQIFNNIRALLNLYDPVSPCFFISVQQNTFNNFDGQNNKYIIQITNFEFPQSTVGILNNSFIDISSNGSSNVIGYTTNRGTFAFNSVSGSEVNGYFFLLTSDYFQNIVFFENTIDSAKEFGLYSIQATDCDNITIRDGIATNIQSNWTFINIDCSSLYTQVILMNYTFQNVTRGPTSGLLEAVNFISIINEQFNASSQSTILFQHVSFSNVLLYNGQYATQSIYGSSMIFILSIQASSQFINITFDSVLATPDAGIMTLSNPTITFTNSMFQNMSFGSIDGAIDLTSDNLLISGCTFENNSGSPIDGTGLFKLGNRNLSNPGFYVTITNCTFSDNVAPYGTILYTTAALVNLSVNNVTMLNNQVTEKGGLVYFFGGSDSTVSITNTNIIQNAGYDKSYPSLEAISFDSTGVNISAAVANCNFTVSGNAIGAFVSISTLSPISLILNNISYTSQDAIYSSNSPTNIRPEFGLFEGDNFAVHVNGLQTTNVSLNQTSLFVIHCYTVGKTSYNWNLVINESVFSNMNLSEALIEIDSDGDAQGALDSLSLMIQNTQFSNISWLAATTTASSSMNTSVLGGIINSLTSQIGRDFSSASASSITSNFTVSLQNCSFTKLTGTGGLIFNTVESLYDGVLLVNASNFSTLSSSGPGAVVNPSTALLTSFNSNLPPLSSINSSRNNSLVISQSYFENITAQEGCIVDWQSAYRGLAVSMRDNNFSSISCAQDGGILYANYYGSNFINTLINNRQTTLEHALIITSINNNITNINVGSGGFMFLSGESTLFQVDIENSTFSAINASQNGGVFCTSQSLPQEITGSSSSTSTSNSRLLSSQAQTGNFTITNNNFMNISASNGGIIYDSTNKNTINFSIISNSMNSVTASQRGGVLYATNPGLNITNNTFTNIAANGAGNLVFSLYGDVNSSALAKSNNISNQSESLVAFGPTNLQIEFISTLDGSILQLENNDPLQYNPTAPNLTSYSLSDYLISVSLVYLGVQGSQVVFDGSLPNQMNLTMYFTSPSDSTPTKTRGYYNCSNSICTIAPNDIILKGLAGDRILVNATYESASYTQSQLFYISLRACIPGEINQTDIQECSYCKATTYSLIPTDLQCSDCPNADAICNGGTNISINPGYYRSNSSSTTLVVFNCNDTSAPRCLGGPNNTCIEPFTGPGCLQCDGSIGYVSSGKVAGCDQCYDKETLIAYATILVIITIGYQILMVYVTYTENRTTHEQANEAPERAQRDANKAKNELKPGQFMVIFSTFNQISSTFANMDVGTVTSLLGVTENVGNSNAKVIFSLRCLFRLAVQDDFSDLRFQILVYVFSPLAKVLVALILELIRSLIWRDKKGFKAGIRKSLVKIGAVAVVITLLEQPAIIGILCAYLTCDRLDPYIDDTYIQGYNTIQCYTDRYNFFSHVVVIPALVFWAFVVPLIIFYALYKNRKKLHTSLDCRLVLGNFYTSYKEEAYYWGLVIISLKITIFVLNAVLVGSEVVKGVVFIIVIHLYFILLRWRPPFRNKRLFIAEKLCCYAYMMMLTLVLFRISFDQDGLRNLCSVLILVSIVFAGAYAVINLALLYLAQAKAILNQRVQKKKDKKICIETLNELKVYHESNDNHRHSRKRRKVITMDLPKRLRNTEEFEQTFKKQVQKSKPRKSRSRIYKSMIQVFYDQNESINEKQPKSVDNPQKAPNLAEISFLDTEKVQSHANNKKVINLKTSYEQEHHQTVQKSDSPSPDNYERIRTLPIEIEIGYGNVSKAQNLQRFEPFSPFSDERALKSPLEIKMNYNNVSKDYASQKPDSLSPGDGERVVELPNGIDLYHDVKINFDEDTPNARLK